MKKMIIALLSLTAVCAVLFCLFHKKPETAQREF